MPGILTAATKAAVEGFSGMQSSDRRRDAYVDFVSMLLAFVIAVVILAFVGQWLWNNAVVDLLTIAKPSRSIWQILGLMIFASLIHQ